MEENKMITHNMNSTTREATSKNHSSISLESNNILIMNITQACKSPNITDNNGDKCIIASVHTSYMPEKANDDDENGEGRIRVEEISGRERVKRHREEVMGKVQIPKNWGKEKQLKDWIDNTSFDALFPPHTSIITARDALIADGRKARSQRLRLHTSSSSS